MTDLYQALKQGEIPAFKSLAGESLCVDSDEIWNAFVRRIGIENLRAVHESPNSGEMVACGGFYRMGQWFGGKCIPTAGITVIAVNVAHRGRGVCGRMLRRMLQELSDLNVPLASLHMSTQGPYRSVGFEQAGSRTRYEISIGELGPVQSDLPVARLENPSLELLNKIASDRAARSNGNLQRTDGMWERILCPYKKDSTITYLFGSESEPHGAVVLQKRGRDDYQTLNANDVILNTAEAYQRFIHLLRDHRSMNSDFAWEGELNDPMLALSAEAEYKTLAQIRWMNRIIRFQDAIEQRGYPQHVSGQLHVDISDSLFPENAGRWVIHVRDGGANVERGGEGKLALSVRQLVPLYTSFMSATRLREIQWLSANDEAQVQLADQVFGGPDPWMTEMF